MMLRRLLWLSVAAVLAACAPQEEPLPGEREPIRADAPQEISTGSELGASRPVGLSAPRSLSAWTHRGANPAHNAPHLAFTQNPNLVWRTEIGQGEDRRRRITAEPVIAGGRIFTLDAASRVTALSMNGQVAWSRPILRGLDALQVSGGGMAYGAGRLFVSSTLGQLVAIEPETGAVLWRQRIEGNGASSPMVAGGLVYIVTRDGRALALDVRTGRIEWSITGAPGQAYLTGGPAPALAGDLVVFPFATGEIIAAFRQGGLTRWRSSVTGTRAGVAAAAIADVTDPVVRPDRIFAASQRGRVVALDRAFGERIWTAREGAQDPVWPAGNSVFLVSDENRLVRLDAATGERIWALQLPNFIEERETRQVERYTHHGPIMASGLLWVASSDGALRGFNPANGEMVVRKALPAAAATAPVIVDEQMVIVLADGTAVGLR